MIVYFLQFISVEDRVRDNLSDVIDEKVNKVLYSKKSSLGPFAFYLVKI